MKRVFIIHGWGGNPDEPHLKWLKDELEKRGYKVEAPLMPDPDYPKIETWVPFIQRLAGEVDEETFFIGHSIGCQAILRYLETLPEDKRIGGAVFIAGWYNVRNLETEEDREIVGPWVNTPHQDEKIKRALNKGVVFLSDNDPFVALENAEAWEKRTHAKVVVESGKGHFNEEAGVLELPEVLEAILLMQ